MLMKLSLPQARPRPAPQLFVRRGKAWLVAGLLCLAASLAVLKFSAVMTHHTRAELTAAEARLREAEQREAAATKGAERARLAHALLKEAEAAGFSVREWDERRFNMKQVTMSREALNSLLNEVARSPGGVFAAEQFDVAVKREEDGLFSTPKDLNSEVMVSLKGSLLSRAGKARP
jgi:hypothetical protein